MANQKTVAETECTIILDGDRNQDILIPQEAHIPVSTKDPALWLASTGSDNLIRRIPGGVWTQRKILLGLMWAWEAWEETAGSARVGSPYALNKDESFPKWSPYPNGSNDERSDSNPTQVEAKAHLERANWHYAMDKLDAINESYQWDLRALPRKNPMDSELVLRASTVTPMRRLAKIGDHQEIEELPKKRLSMHLIGDYDVSYRYSHKWNHEHVKAENDNSEEFPARLILLGSSLPFEGRRPLMKKEDYIPISTSKDDVFWTSLLQKDGKTHEEGYKATLVIVGLDMLRMKSADIAFDQSWDRILEDFNREKLQCESVKALCRFEHLIVRIGVTGVIYHYRERNKEGNLTDEGKTLLIYDPNAPRIWFRAPDDQGNILGSRSALAACIAARLARGRTAREQHTSSAKARDLIIRGAKDAVCFLQELYSRGFGENPARVQTFTTPCYYKKVYSETVLRGSDSDNDGQQRLPQRNRYIAHVQAPIDDSPMEWGIIRSALRMGIPETLGTATTSGRTKFWWHRKAAYCAEQRRLLIGMQIVMQGHQAVLNSALRQSEYHKCVQNLKEWKQLSNSKVVKADILATASEWDIPRMLVEFGQDDESAQDDIETLLLYLATAYPVNTPIACFGKLTALGQWDVETYTNIRNLLTNHLRQGKTGKGQKPLNIAVFGGPGSGKSFGVKQIADELGIPKPLEFNVSQFRGKEDLDSAILKVSDALARRSPGDPSPLVFFDEFDCSGPNGGPDFMWLSYFLEPMQDGTYQHPGGTLTLGNAIFVFAGGIHASYREFQDRAVGFGSEHERHLAKVRKFPDFVSRLRGFIDVGSLNRKETRERYSPNEREIPYLHRALTLRGMLEREGSVKRDGGALIDGDVAEAFLTVSRFQHGKRSLESMLRGCVRIKQQIVQSSFPSQQQLDMHTWGGEFREKMHLPGSHWLTDFLFIPSQPDLSSPENEWKEVTDWDLLAECDDSDILDAETQIKDCSRRLLEGLFNPASEVWLRKENILETASKLQALLEKRIKGVGGKDLKQAGLYRPHELISSLPDEADRTKGPTDSGVRPVKSSTNTWDGPPSLTGYGASLKNVVIPFVMLEEVRPINLRLQWTRGSIVLRSDSTRLAEQIERESELGTQLPHPSALWTKDWSWKKSDKVRILRRILKNFYIAVHGENRWADFEKGEKQRAKLRRCSKLGPGASLGQIETAALQHGTDGTL